ncbi:Potassium voltage-gated channel sub H member 7 [Schistosoma haematobium]|uniref:Potassium voltage-gated channel sub H member 7 n=1 Tax=Schistosoma haematobium TaxID=6185 RepID=A0A922LSB5_SCHHA|nr:Potassium voltage-gated channel sub H member 7 [Schistosoma haematobium]KAH9592392.1 Potassium voltage-gated channel sub H member 7 [Schistosoma haematobium]CAH8680319.1 unnamed protein product [Schistosoma haematobium]
MPIKRGHVAPQNTFIDTLIQKFDSQGRKFLIANAVLPGAPIIFCNDEFCSLCGYSRAQILRRSAALEFLYGPSTSFASIKDLKTALSDYEEKVIMAILCNKSGNQFICQITVAPVRNAEGQVRLYILTFVVNSEFRKTKSTNLPSKTSLTNDRKTSKNYQRQLCCIPVNDTVGEESRTISQLTNVHDHKDELEQPISRCELENSTSANSTERDLSCTCLMQPGELKQPLPRSNSLVSISPNVPKEPKRGRNYLVCRGHSIVSTSSHMSRGNSLVGLSRGCGGIVVNTDSWNASRRHVSEKVAEMLSMGPELNPEQKLHSPRIHPFTLKHYGPIKAVWDWLVLLFVIYTAVFTPYAAAFLLPDAKRKRRHNDGWGRYSGLTSYQNPLQIIDLFVDIMFIVDIFINFRTTYVNRNDELISHPGQIAIHYFKGWFLIDVVAAIPFDLLLFGAETDEMATLIGLLKTARLLRLVRVVRKLDRYSEYGAAVLLLLMATFVLIAHWLACIWYAIGNVERQQFNVRIGWLDQLAEQIKQPFGNRSTLGPSIKSKYITALYFTFSSLTSVGFGNVSPNTNSEKIFSVCVMLVGSLMYAGIFGHVSAIIQRLYSGTARYHAQMVRVKEFIRFHQIPNPLKRRLEEFFQHAWSYTNGIDMNLVLRSFPECLQADICLHLNRNLLNTCSPFKNASQGCLRALALKLKTTHVPPGDTLVHKGDVLNFLCFIARGSIEIMIGCDILAVLGQGDVFGENPTDFTSMGQSKYNVRALTYCDLHRIQRDDLLEILEMYPEFAKQFKKELEITFDLRDYSDPCILNPELIQPSDKPVKYSSPKHISISHQTNADVGDNNNDADDNGGVSNDNSDYEEDFDECFQLHEINDIRNIHSMPFIDCYSNDQSPIVRTKPLINPNISSTKSFEQINRYNNIYTCDPNVFSFTNDNNNELDIAGLSSRNKIMYYPIHDKQSIVEDSADTSQPSSAITHPIHSLINNSKPCEGSNPVENQSLGRISSSDIIVNLLTRLSSMENNLLSLEKKLNTELNQLSQLIDIYSS